MSPQQILVELQWATYVDPQSILPYFTDKVLFFFVAFAFVPSREN